LTERSGGSWSLKSKAPEFTSFFAGTDIVPPGIAEAQQWIADLTAPPPDHGLYVRCRAGVKK
jgi:S-adenosyl methyltransferase